MTWRVFQHAHSLLGHPLTVEISLGSFQLSQKPRAGPDLDGMPFELPVSVLNYYLENHMKMFFVILAFTIGLSQSAFADWTFEAAFSYVPVKPASSNSTDVDAAKAETDKRYNEALDKGIDHMNRFCGKEKIKSMKFSSQPLPNSATGPDTLEAVVTAVCDSSSYHPEGMFQTYIR